MANRTETAERKAALLRELRAAQKRGADVSLPLSQRELCNRHGLSAQTVSKVLQELVKEGVLYTVPRVGTFLGRGQFAGAEPFLMVRKHPEPGGFEMAMQTGFEAQIGILGGSTLVLTPQEAALHLGDDSLPPLSGVFEPSGSPVLDIFMRNELPCAGFEAGPGQEPYLDIVNFDNVGGGQKATQHLLNLGHTGIAYLALHKPESKLTRFGWSAERESGWQLAMSEAGQPWKELCFHPQETSPLSSDDQADVAQSVSAELIGRKDITAVVTANSFAARGLLVALKESHIPAARWPAIVCFDLPDAADSVVSCLQLPWEQIGREAAQVLWERRTGRLSGPPARRLVAMQILPRLSCRPDWAALSLAHNRVMQNLSQALQTPVSGVARQGSQS